MLLSYSDEDLGPKLEGRLDSRDHLCYHYFFAHQTFVHVFQFRVVVSDVEAA